MKNKISYKRRLVFPLPQAYVCIWNSYEYQLSLNYIFLILISSFLFSYKQLLFTEKLRELYTENPLVHHLDLTMNNLLY